MIRQNTPPLSCVPVVFYGELEVGERDSDEGRDDDEDDEHDEEDGVDGVDLRQEGRGGRR